MSSTCISAPSEKFLNWIAQRATAFHLWCAEKELRLVDTSGMTADLRAARERNLDLLREYRSRGEFPLNCHDPQCSVPCFIDDDGRQCAVACLMFASSDEASALKVAASANFARIRQMQFPELDAWANRSGLTKAELARIQPGYPPTPEQLNNAFDFLFAIWLVGSLALISILVNSTRLVFAFAHRFSTTLIGLITGVMLLALCAQVDLGRFSHTHALQETVWQNCLTATGLGFLAIALAVMPFFRWRKHKPNIVPSAHPEMATAFAETPLTKTPKEPEPPKPPAQAWIELIAAMILALGFLIGPALVYFKMIGPGADSRFQAVHQYGHQGVVMGVAFNGDGSLVATAADDGTAVLWDAAVGNRLKTFYRGHTDGITSVAMSGDGKRIVTGSMDKTAVIWDASTGEKLHTLRGHSRWVDGVAISRDGKFVVTGASDNMAILWDATTGEKLRSLQGHKLAVTSVALNADATRVLTGSYDKTAILWDAATGTQIQTFREHADFVSSVAISGDAKYVVTGSWDKTAVLWDVATGKKIQTFQRPERRVLAVALSDDAKFVVTGSTDNLAIMWDAATGNHLRTFHRHLQPVTCVAITRDGKRLATGSGDHSAFLWDMETGRKELGLGTFVR